MIAGLMPYPAYKDSNSTWVGKLPAHWFEKRAKYFFREVDERSSTGNEELMSVSHKTGVTPRKSNVTMFRAESNVGHRICRPDDLVINTMWAFMAALGVARQVGVVSPSYAVYRPRCREKLHPQFVDRLLRIENYKSEYLCRSKGINSSRLRLYPDQFLRIPVICPPPDEQSAIVRFLDHADQRIRRYVKAKRRLIALLNEQKQAIIHRTVTRGLDPNVRLKPSGVEWLGDVPEHWEVLRLKRLLREKLAYGANAASEYDNREWPRYLRITDFRSDGSLREDTFRSLPPEIACDNKVAKGDVLFARSGATVGKAFLVREDLGEACYAGYLIRARLTAGRMMPEFLFAYTQGQTFMQWKEATFLIATIQNIGADKYADLPVPAPPLEEQKKLLIDLEMSLHPICLMCELAEREISLIREYRTRLIADVVTGKLDVRDAATRLPDEADEQDSLDDASMLVDGDEIIDPDLDAVPEEVEA